jgi:hypothetical protein
MKFDSLAVEDLMKYDLQAHKVFVLIPFLYFPVFLELKRREKEIQCLYLRINLEHHGKMDVLLTLLRLFSLPDSYRECGRKIDLVYQNKTVSIDFYQDGPGYTGNCVMSGSLLHFSEDKIYIKVEMSQQAHSIIVLPEGDGLYYMNLDKQESEEAGRLSIIGDPFVLKEHYQWLRDQ